MLLGGDGLTDNVLHSIIRELDELPIPYSVDVAIYSTITNEASLEHISRKGAVLYERPSG